MSAFENNQTETTKDWLTITMAVVCKGATDTLFPQILSSIHNCSNCVPAFVHTHYVSVIGNSKIEICIKLKILLLNDWFASGIKVFSDENPMHTCTCVPAYRWCGVSVCLFWRVHSECFVCIIHGLPASGQICFLFTASAALWAANNTYKNMQTTQYHTHKYFIFTFEQQTAK